MAHTSIPTAPGYTISRTGQIFSVTSDWRGYGIREMSQTPNADGYPGVRLMIEGMRKRIAVHILMAHTFLPRRPSPDHQIRHLDGDKSNPGIDNLCWGTAKENADDRERHGKTSLGDKHAAAVRAGRSDSLTDKELQVIRGMTAKQMSQRAIAAAIGRNQATVCAALGGRNRRRKEGVSI